MRIPSAVSSFKPGTGKTFVKRFRGPMSYKTSNGIIDVRYWHRWPSYDFIFGVPARGHKYEKEEAAYFAYRDTRRRKVKCGFYVDMRELDILAAGFKELLRIAKRRAKR